ncbi:MAG: YidC/Oxa1 family insertase periplasmic-domain containing protein [Planctomycetes bacterium]|nr:YidC/Oxa1 family insertase periplasmic-domain containing protein [Planctomycetota bacterium]
MEKDTLRNLMMAFAVVLVAMWILPRLIPPPPKQAPRPDGAMTPSTVGAPAGDGRTAPGRSAAGQPEAQAAEPGNGTALTVLEADEERQFSLGSAETNGVDEDSVESPYRMRLLLSNVGASVESATMTDHAETIDKPDRYKLLGVFEDLVGNRHRSLAVESITIDDQIVSLHDKKWHTEGPHASQDNSGQTIIFRLDIVRDDKPVLKITRTFTLHEQTIDSGRHDLAAEIAIENLADTSQTVIVAYRGGVGVRSLGSIRGPPSQFIDWGIFREGRVDGERQTFDRASKAAAASESLYAISASEIDTRLSWAATANTYFTCTLAPLNADGSDNAAYLGRAEPIDLDGSGLSVKDVTIRFITRAQKLDPHATMRYPVAIYIGEKDAKAFKTVEDYKRRNYYYQVSQGYGWCTFTSLVELMIWLLNGLSALTRDFGVAIIILVLIVRTLLHPITKKGQVNMVKMQKKMQELAPKIEEIKKKYANDKARLNQEMMKLNINPAGQILTCLPMMLQMPIWVALYISLSNNILIRHQGSVLLPWVHDMTVPDALYTFSSPIIIPLLGWSIPAFNLLPLLVAVFMYTQQKLQPKPTPSPNMTDQQRQQQEMMQKMGPIMSIMMLIIFYPMPAGLNLYIMTSSLFGTIEQKRIRAHIKEQEDAGTLLKPKEKEKPITAADKGKPRKPSFMERMQKAVDEAQKKQAQRPQKAKAKRKR